VKERVQSPIKFEGRAFEKVTKLHCTFAGFGKWCAHENWKKCPT